MKLWTFVTEEARNSLWSQGFLAGDPGRIADPSFRPAYEWMVARMVERIGPPPSVEWPIWAWRLWRGRERPDPGDEEYSQASGPLWMLGFEAPDEAVVLSDFDAWHHVLNGWLLFPRDMPDDEAERQDEAFVAALRAAGVDWHARPYPEPFRSMVEASWLGVFDVDLARAADGGESVQATLWRLEADAVFEETPCGR